MTDDQRQRLLRWVTLAGREHVVTDSGFEITPLGDGPGYRVTLGDTITLELDGAFEISSRGIDAVERLLILRLGLEGRGTTATALRLPWSPTDLPSSFVLWNDDDPTVWVLKRQDGTEVARVRHDAAVEFSSIADADPEQLRQSLLDPGGLPLLSVPAAARRPLPVPVVAASVAHTRRRQCPGPYLSQCEELALGNWEFLVRCTQCGALFSIGLADYSGVIPMSRRTARKRFPEAQR